MKLANLEVNGNSHLGVCINDSIIDVTKALANEQRTDLPTSMMDYINADDHTQHAFQDYVTTLSKTNPAKVAESEVTFGPVVPHPEKIICVGLNYRKHADETNSPYPEVPILFNKFNNTLTGHNHNVVVPNVTKELDYEVELAIVIGQTASQVSEDEALNYVLGYATANDLSARDLQLRTPQWLLGKTLDDFNPIGPYLVTKDEVPDPQQLALTTTVNGKTRQDSNTSDMIFTCKEIIRYISQHFTLKPGDIILTGTPEGVAMGMPETEREYLKSGDTVTVSIEKLGSCTTRFI
ncbi:fumarylacetoacetate hydrolase family protein [Geomicrobium sediminis]|uniref:2-keto-4-pentenoate hydratase/2-oxohepta-3-ene-1,7-dioic acid hydratase in catechol pathway n=1 Tax=Geomicrobium sediminis TaxID=1347788 RepID=A0ABS2PE47_9BACL|nr:fumarylacetoacetate hydrolase family protein [Geomicrobium sediminis]MBM7633406.1 2-keto-4-pentenoate hydratase/2-oxohepta-3-ene-1,7-dioic acid hydratase in catechol pathway [Geomicrobium sediminis]